LKEREKGDTFKALPAKSLTNGYSEHRWKHKR